MTLRSVLPALIALVLIALFWIGLPPVPTSRVTVESPFIGKSAPRFDMEDLFAPAERVVIEQWAGKPFVLNVWGTWCPECYREHDTLLRIKAQGEIPVIGLNWRDERAKAIQYLAQYGDPFDRVGFDPDGRNAIDWGVYGAPETFLVDAQGVVVHKHIGPLDWATWETDFIGRLAGAPGAGQ